MAVEIHRPSYRSAAELLPVARGLLGTEGEAHADPGSGTILLRGRARAVARALEGLRALDVEPVMWRVRSTLTSLRSLSARGVRVRGWIRAGDVRVGRLAGAPGAARAALDLRVRTLATDDSDRVQGEIAVLDGQPAELWTGTTYPERLRQVDVSGAETRIYDTVTLVPVQTGFRVLPRQRAGGKIELEIAPLLQERTLEGVVTRAAAATRIVVEPGEVVAVASISTQEEHRSVDPFAALDHREGTHDAAVLVSIDR